MQLGFACMAACICGDRVYMQPDEGKKKKNTFKVQLEICWQCFISIYLKSDGRQILGTKVETRFCSSSRQNMGHYFGHLAADCSYQHTVQNSKEYLKKKWIKCLKLKKIGGRNSQWQI